jgi:hypothetical protein
VLAGSRVRIGGLEDWSGFRAQVEAVDDERDRKRFEDIVEQIASEDWMYDASLLGRICPTSIDSFVSMGILDFEL